MLHRALLQAVFAASALAIPLDLKPAQSLQKRTNPSIDDGYSDQERTQITDAFKDALQMASYVQLIPASIVDPIFAKYFDPKDKDTVMKVFSNISGGDPNSPVGSDILGKISIVTDYEDADGEYACDGSTMAELRDWDSDNPKIVICKKAGFGHGGIAKGYDGVPKVVCENFDPRMSWKMETLGSILLHEYTHYTNLVAPPLDKETDDLAYGVSGVRAYDKSLATNNADSYSWFAVEVLWSVICSEEYEDPTDADNDDPNCE
ncbi:hypothetical protein N7491_004098 [Penicillium cf. griseofulvum]|uniref:Lysine-specific metallo-endopeptidase domain-containing protein n=1 Tax=Penicillium cf. griseofulvum TaxID=2972120 RepID=A0A9W9T0U7_9EURO|nr:hypothetical protein N7472_001727 [Penicillium cf. griseofulvum]KAJ5441692.1 hypothetical protein N7491_004098 [Penicillium cf. griseofulvum]